MKKSKLIASSFFFLSVFTFYFFAPLEINNKIAGQEAYAENFKKLTLKERRESYLSGYTSSYRTDKNIKILIVPGHDDEYHGTEFEGVREVDLNRELGNHLYNFLKQEKGFSVATTDIGDGYTKTFKKFFTKEEDEIEEFIEDSKDDFKKKIKDGEIEFSETNFHNTAPEKVALRLYGINMWANENDFDLIVHIHFNDYRGRYKDKDPKYNGFAIYVPEKQFDNSKVSKEFAENIFDRLSKYLPISNLKQESDGIVETQELIAIGANKSLDSASLLIEYGYIYEPQFTNPDTRKIVIRDLARQTYAGIKDYFDENISEESPYFYLEDLFKKDSFLTLPNYELQKELANLNYYPPKGKSFNDCPLSGLFGECTEEAVKEFQKNHNLPSTGYVGSMTRKILNGN